MKLIAVIKFSVFIIILLFPVFAGAQKVKYYESGWHDSTMMMNDGSDIGGMQYDNKSKFLYLVTNDDANLYIDLMLADPPSRQKVMMFGLTIWFDPKAKQKKNMGIRFPLASERNMMQRPQGGNQDRNPDVRFREFLDKKNREMELVGFESDNSIEKVDLYLNKDFQGRLEFLDQERMMVHIVMPLKRVCVFQDQEEHAFSLGFETGYMDINRQMGSVMGQRPGGFPGGEMHGGGMPPGGGIRPGGQKQEVNIAALSKPSKMWIREVKLAKRP